jgi:hypothetical protein
VSDTLRVRTVARVLEMSLPERVALALSLGDQDRDLFARVNGIDPCEAVRRLRARRSHGRLPSVAAEPVAR